MGVLNADRVNAGIFSGDGSLLSNVTAVGTGLAIENSGSLVGTALTIDFNTGVEVQFSVVLLPSLLKQPLGRAIKQVLTH